MKRLLLRFLQRARLIGPAFRAFESVQALRARRHAPATDDGLPVPPPQLIVRVAWTGDVHWFLESGREAFETIRERVPLDGVRSVLDFGCGCGRVTRYWSRFAGEVAGSDRDERAIDWCREHLPFARFEVNGLAPPLAFGDGAFDLVYALSVFTHLPEELQLAWLRELHRTMRGRALLLLTTHGARYRDRLDADERARFDGGELVVRWEEVAGTNLCSAYHPEPYVRERLADGFDVVKFEREGARGNPHQDLWLLRKR